jgi:Peptidase A4 family
MQNQNWRFLSRVIAVTTVTALFVSVTSLALAQRIGGEERNAIFASAPRVPTSVKGVTVFAAPPKGFNPLTATNRELLTYGLPQRPDQIANAKAYQHWEKAMLALQTRAIDVQAKPYSSREMMPAPSPAAAAIDGATAAYSYNWSGIANVNKNKSWKDTTSFNSVASIWNVPVANPPFGAPCSDGPWAEATWNGIDGFNNGDVIQGGSFEYWDRGGCGGGPVEYYGWVEWYPSYPILEVYCNYGQGNVPCPVGPGDDFYVETYGAPGTSEQYVFIENFTQQWYGTIGLTYVNGPGLVGSSAEYVVERPTNGGGGLGLFALANYVWEFFDYSSAYDGNGKEFYPGSDAASTNVITMVADDASTQISFDTGSGLAGYQGQHSFWMEDANCAYSGGCTP